MKLDTRMLIGCVVMFGFALLALTTVASMFLWLKAGKSLGEIEISYLWTMSAGEKAAFGGLYSTARNLVLGISLLVVLVILAFSLRKLSTEYGDAHWQTVSELKANGNFGPLGGELILGKVTNPKSGKRDYITTSKAQPHCMMVAPTGAGKGVGFVIPNMELFVGSAIVLDVKGELWEKTSRLRKQNGNDVFRFDPLNGDGLTHCFNPLAELSERTFKNKAQQRQITYTELERMAQYFIAATDGNLESWLGSARRLFISGAILAIERNTPTIGDVLRILQFGGNHSKEMQKLSAEVDHPSAKKIFEEFSGYDDTQWSNYTSVLFGAGGLGLWSNMSVDMATKESDFTFSTFRSKKQTMYICLDRNDLKTMAPLIRLLFGSMMATIMRSEPDKETEPYPIMFMIDEFTQLGKMDVVAESIDVIRSHGGRMMIIAQNLPRLDVLYTENGRKALMAGAGARLYLTPNEDKTGDHIAKILGHYTKRRMSKTQKSAFDIVTANQTASISHEAAPLLSFDKVMKFDESQVIIMMKGQQPIKAFRNIYYEDPMLSGLFDEQTGDLPDPVNIFDRYEIKKNKTAAEIPEEIIDASSVHDAENYQSDLVDNVEEATDEEKTAALNEAEIGIGDFNAKYVANDSV